MTRLVVDQVATFYRVVDLPFASVRYVDDRPAFDVALLDLLFGWQERAMVVASLVIWHRSVRGSAFCPTISIDPRTYSWTCKSNGAVAAYRPVPPAVPRKG